MLMKYAIQEGKTIPFRSLKQQHYLWAKKPSVAKEFASKTDNYDELPEKVSPEKSKKPSKWKMLQKKESY